MGLFSSVMSNAIDTPKIQCLINFPIIWYVGCNFDLYNEMRRNALNTHFSNLIRIFCYYMCGNITNVKCSKHLKYNAFVLYFHYQVIVYYLRTQLSSCGLYCQMLKTLKIQWSRIVFLLFGNMGFFSVSNVKPNRDA